MSRAFSLAFLLALGAVIVTGPALASPAVPPEDSAKILQDIQSASTPAQHDALAAHYQGEAEASRKGAEEHRAMAEKMNGMMKTHCTEAAKIQEDMAVEYDAMAKLHEKAAGR